MHPLWRLPNRVKPLWLDHTNVTKTFAFSPSCGRKATRADDLLRGFEKKRNARDGRWIATATDVFAFPCVPMRVGASAPPPPHELPPPSSCSKDARGSANTFHERRVGDRLVAACCDVCRKWHVVASPVLGAGRLPTQTHTQT